MYRNGSARRTAASAGGQTIEIATPAAANPQPASQKMTVRVDRIHAGYTGCSDDRRVAASGMSSGGVLAIERKPTMRTCQQPPATFLWVFTH